MRPQTGLEVGAPPRRKALGQHHLRQGELCRPLLDFLAVEDREVIEIGSGGGVLTAELLASARSVTAVELDLFWACYLARRLAGPRLRIVVADALDLDWRRLARGTAVAGNLPYGIATALVERLLDFAPGGTRLGFLVQLEVAARLVAAIGDPHFGSLSVLVAARGQATVLGRVRPGSFIPPPRVDSAYVGIVLETRAESIEEWHEFKVTVRAGFQRRRKTLLNSLKSAWGPTIAQAAVSAIGGDPRRRAETLSLDEWRLVHRTTFAAGRVAVARRARQNR